MRDVKTYIGWLMGILLLMLTACASDEGSSSGPAVLKIYVFAPDRPIVTRADNGNVDAAEAEKAIKDQFDHSQKVLTLRQEYYKKYSKFLTAKQIQHVYDLEKQSMNRLSKRGPMNQHGKRNAGPRPNAGHPKAPGKGKHNGQFPQQPNPQKQNK